MKGDGEAGGGSQGGGGAHSGTMGDDDNAASRPSGGRAAGWRPMGDALRVIPTPALIAEGTRRAGVIWLTVPGQDRPVPAWHIWRDPPAAAYVVSGPGEQPLPGVAGAARVTVTVPSKDTGGALVTWTASVYRVDPGSPEWEAVIGPLAAARLNADLDPISVVVFRLAPE